ncbi:MAG TPA: PP2C family protein-serine/threonine phosphatase [Roseiflexaceae bacterium]|nr:PP2C family protein-serine/threonine phosphatase [Roseiflexaceae bacterium]
MQQLTRLISRHWPAFEALPLLDRRSILQETVSILLLLPWSLASLAGLLLSVEPAVLRSEWPALLVLGVLLFPLTRFAFFWMVEQRPGEFVRYSSSLAILAPFSMLLLFGPTALLTTSLLYQLINTLVAARQARALAELLTLARNTLSQQMLQGTWLIGLVVYRALGGVVPFPGLGLVSFGQALALLLTAMLIYLGLLLGMWATVQRLGFDLSFRIDLRQFGGLLGISGLPGAFGILAAAIYVQMGLAAYLLFMAAALAVGVVAMRLGHAIDQAWRRTREMERLEQLSRAILAGPPDGSGLPDALRRLVPAMFIQQQIAIVLDDGRTLLSEPEDVPAPPAAVWSWLRAGGEARLLRRGHTPPWGGPPAERPTAVAPIRAVQGGAPIGGIYLVFGEDGDLERPVPVQEAALTALQALAAQIASALHRAEEYTRELALQRVTQELELAAQIQASFLPRTLPVVAGWQVAAALRSARETSGDFYDVLALPDGKLGLLIADVADKGTGAALYMALSRTLIRTFAFAHPDRPEQVLLSANQRILTDTDSSMFVTVFYGVLDPRTGALRYCNAGHNPPYLLRAAPDAEPLALRKTGIPLGITDELPWAAGEVVLGPGDLLALYTDGVSEAHNSQQELYEEVRLLEVLRQCRRESAAAVRDSILDSVSAFVGHAPQSDDLTVLVLMREPTVPNQHPEALEHPALSG